MCKYAMGWDHACTVHGRIHTVCTVNGRIHAVGTEHGRIQAVCTVHGRIHAVRTLAWQPRFQAIAVICPQIFG